MPSPFMQSMQDSLLLLLLGVLSIIDRLNYIAHLLEVIIAQHERNAEWVLPSNELMAARTYQTNIL